MKSYFSKMHTWLRFLMLMFVCVLGGVYSAPLFAQDVSSVITADWGYNTKTVQNVQVTANCSGYAYDSYDYGLNPCNGWGSITFEALNGKRFSRIELGNLHKFSGDHKNMTAVPNGCVYDSETNSYIWEGSETSVEFSIVEGIDVSIRSFSVWYEGGASGSDPEPEPEPEPLPGEALEGTPQVVSLPYTNTFDTPADIANLFAIDSNEDGCTFRADSEGGNGFVFINQTTTAPANNDYLVICAAELVAGKKYNLSFKAKSTNGAQQFYTVFIGENTTASSLNKNLQFSWASSTEWESKSVDEFSVEISGSYYFAIKSTANSGNGKMLIDNFHLEAAPADMPAAVDEVTVEPNDAGELSATISFTMPATNYGGDEYAQGRSLTYHIYRCQSRWGDLGVGDVEITSGNEVAGENVEYIDNAATNGDNYYAVVITDGALTSRLARGSAYVGIDIPQSPSNVQMSANGNRVTLTWQAPTRGQNNGNIGTLTYNVYPYINYTLGEAINDSPIIETTYSFDYDMNSGEQRDMKFAVKAVNAGGSSNESYTPNSISVGAPYSLPFVVDFSSSSNRYKYEGTNCWGGESNSEYDMYTWTGDETLNLITGKINFAGSNAQLSFDYKADASNITFDVIVLDQNGNENLIETISNPTDSYQRAVVDFTGDYKNDNWVKVMIRVNLKGAYYHAYFDNLSIIAKAPTYAVTVDTEIADGSISADKATAEAGETVTLTATPDPGFVLDSWSVTTTADGTPVRVSNNQFTMPGEAVTVSATFVEKTYTEFNFVGSSPVAEDGITPAWFDMDSHGVYLSGISPYYLTFTSSGHSIKRVDLFGIGDATGLEGKDARTNVIGSVTLDPNKTSFVWEGYASYVKFNGADGYYVQTARVYLAKNYSVAVADIPEGGSVSVLPAGGEAEEGSEVTLTPEAEDGFVLQSITVEDAEGNNVDVDENTYTFTMPSSNVTVSAVFTSKTNGVISFSSQKGGNPDLTGTDIYNSDVLTFQDDITILDQSAYLMERSSVMANSKVEVSLTDSKHLRITMTTTEDGLLNFTPGYTYTLVIPARMLESDNCYNSEIQVVYNIVNDWNAAAITFNNNKPSFVQGVSLAYTVADCNGDGVLVSSTNSGLTFTAPNNIQKIVLYGEGYGTISTEGFTNNIEKNYASVWEGTPNTTVTISASEGSCRFSRAKVWIEGNFAWLTTADFACESEAKAAGKITSLSSDVLVFDAAVSLYNVDLGSHQAYIKDSEDSRVCNVTLAVDALDATKLNVILPSEITALGSYTLVIPAEVLCKGSNKNNEINVEYEVVDAHDYKDAVHFDLTAGTYGTANYATFYSTHWGNLYAGLDSEFGNLTVSSIGNNNIARIVITGDAGMMDKIGCTTGEFVDVTSTTATWVGNAKSVMFSSINGDYDFYVTAIDVTLYDDVAEDDLMDGAVNNMSLSDVCEFNTEVGKAYDVNNDGIGFVYDANGYAKIKTYGTQTEDYLVVAGFNLTAGIHYTASADVKAIGGMQTASLVLGTSATEMNTFNKDILTLNTSNVAWETKSTTSNEYFTVSANGTYYLAVKCTNGTGEFDVDNISIDEAGTKMPKAVEDLAVTPDTEGALSATIAFTMPTENYDGEAYDHIRLTYTIYNDELQIRTAQQYSGEPVNETVVVGEAGDYTFRVIISDGTNGDSREVRANVHIGQDVPRNPQNVHISAINGNYITVTWDAVTEDIHGQSIAPKYNVYVDGNKDNAELIDALTYTFSYDLNAGAQRSVRFSVSAQNATGESSATSTSESLLAGAADALPYSLPFAESGNPYYSGDYGMGSGYINTADGITALSMSSYGTDGTTAEVTTGKIALGNEDAILSFGYKNNQNGNTLTVKVVDSEGNEATLVNAEELSTTSGFDTYELNLNGTYKNSSWIQIKISTTFTANFQYFYLKDLAVNFETKYIENTLTLKAKSEKAEYWATFGTDEDVFFTEEAELFSVYVSNDGEALLMDKDAFESATLNINGEDVDGYIVPANTGVLLTSGDVNTATYYVIRHGEAVDPIVTPNLLRPAAKMAEEPASGYYYYKLAYGDNTNKTKLGFWWGASEGGKFNVNAGTAYLAIPQAQAANIVRGFVLDEEGIGTRINAIESLDENTGVYTLDGRKVSNDQKLRKGTYIVNGKKIVNF